MTLAVMQPYFLPYIGYWQMIKAVDEYVIYDDVNFIKGGWINRNNMLLGGDKFMFNLQLRGASSNKLIKQIEVDSNQSKFLRSVEHAYKKAPYFREVMPLLEQICDYQKEDLGRFLGNSLMLISDYLEMRTKFIYSSAIEKQNELRGQDKILHICEKLQADRYFNAIGGQELYSKEDFSARDIELKFLKTLPVEYKQFGGEFLPWLSIIDVMMFNSVAQIDSMLQQYELI